MAIDETIIDALQRSKIEFAGNATTLADTLFLKFSIQSRISIVVTAAFNVFASAAVVVTVLYDSWRVASLRVPRRKLDFFTKIPTAHIFSNALALATMTQGSIFISVQTMNLQDVLTNNCSVYSQITWTAAWLVGYTILIFSSEAAIRSFNPACSASPCKSYASVNWILVVVFSVLTWIPSYLRPVTMSICTADLTQWVEPWSDIGTGLASSLILFYIVNAVVLLFRLRRTEKLCFEQRIATRNQVYYLFVNSAIFAFTLPFWIQATTSHATNAAAMIMSIAINLFGIVNGVLFLLLRATGQNLITRSANPVWFMKPPRRYTDSTEMAVAQQMIMPVGLERNNSIVKRGDFSSGRFGQRREPEQPDRGRRRNSIPEAVFPDGRSSMERLTAGIQSRESFLSLSTTSRDRSSGLSSIVPMTDIDDFILLPPQPYFSHRRRSSDISAATVQIGLCLSSIPVPLPAQQAHNSSKVTHIPVDPPETLTSARFSGPKKTSTDGSSASLDSSLPIHPLQVNPPSLKWSLEDVSAPTYTTNERSDSTLDPPPLALESVPNRASQRLTDLRASYETNSSRSKLQGGLPSNPKSSQAVPRRGRNDSAWPLPERFSLLPDKTYSQIPWI
ncbi:uncharacterized protein CIMG_02651 [Coccidioides immitis RS]|uniref:Uncharacterized protein n=1 Tax=Coccidioides immitis (strain RS) TaxID=246410 RepID=J3KLU2_COCIM|nr:uncharacterized protein CIMG_02651 [Coccidioides immitis RS]EAS37297.3 hypothetical protein CIMG_02651 [Coccidioides immitis RS]TPX24736.1 hypothetical protein DIZ76_010174 [Coccidioides immitis]